MITFENVTKTYLSHFIHDNLNMTFQEYVSSVRFERALKLIRSTSMCLTDISVGSGFSVGWKYCGNDLCVSFYVSCLLLYIVV